MDEAQIYPVGTYTQMLPTLNVWEPSVQFLTAGVPNGLRNSVLYLHDVQNPRYKKYRIPAHNNPFYTWDEDQENQRRWGGIQDDRYQQLILGRHGQAAFQVIPRETIITEPYAFSNQRYSSANRLKGERYNDVLLRPELPKELNAIIFAIDTGFVDPTVIHVIGRSADMKWRVYVRYKITRLEFTEQEEIIDWLDTFYNPNTIAIDIGAGGGGSGIIHHLFHDDKYKAKKYNQRILPIQFSEKINAGIDSNGNELKEEAKIVGATTFAQMIQEGQIIYSELDFEGINQTERIAKQNGLSGKPRYFVLAESGNGASDDDHIFASYICFAIAARDVPLSNMIKRLARSAGLHT